MNFSIELRISNRHETVWRLTQSHIGHIFLYEKNHSFRFRFIISNAVWVNVAAVYRNGSVFLPQILQHCVRVVFVICQTKYFTSIYHLLEVSAWQFSCHRIIKHSQLMVVKWRASRKCVLNMFNIRFCCCLNIPANESTHHKRITREYWFIDKI